MRGFDAQHNRLTLAAFAAALLVVAGCSKREEPPAAHEVEISRPVAVHAAYSILAEMPEATNAYLSGSVAVRLLGPMERAGLSVSTNVPASGAKFDIAVVSGSPASEVAGMVREGGVVAEMLEMGKAKMGWLKARLEAFPRMAAQSRLWMPSEVMWIVVGGGAHSLDAMMGLYAREEAFEDLAVASLSSPADIFANCAGTVESALGAFRDDEADAEALPEYFLTRDIPAADWLSFDSVDGDIAAKVRERMRTVQVIRRLVVEGAMLGRKGDEEGAVDAWSRAALRNPGDSFLCERLATLEKNGAIFMKMGNVNGAARCYETLVTVRPDSAANLRGYAQCMLKLGQTNVAERAFTLANTMERKVEDEEGRH